MRKGYRIQPFTPAAPRRMAEFGERLGELPADLHTQHDLRVENWRTGGRGGPVRNRSAKSGNFSAALPLQSQVASTLIYPVNFRRNYLLIINIDAANNLWINLGVKAVVNQCIKIPPGGVWEPWIAPVNDIYIIGDVAGTLGIGIEGTG